ncbi:Uma2 family endonuclease [Tepidicella xavieri]|uniref:Uma2 family endonuclease n=1 Tax=Tepidicella xavieri TaxID=360241 RepID=A0A4R6UE23_9BURK|nr:Uma2 family endonuclease [Tepidicella xavieri]TDQ41344.1 Uma2 family endonuclease [Tepidicella xavieri]
MTALAAMKRFITPQEYLEGELRSEVRHEYVDGQVYAMVGASDRHGLIVNAVAFALTPKARQHGCQLFTSDMKVRLDFAGQEVYYYPDLLLCCDDTDRATYFRERPCLIVEVLSESTERIDRREKWLAYQQLPSLQAYLLVAQDRRQVEVFRRASGWRHELHTEGAIGLPCVDAALSLDEIYIDVSD